MILDGLDELLSKSLIEKIYYESNIIQLTKILRYNINIVTHD